VSFILAIGIYVYHSMSIILRLERTSKRYEKVAISKNVSNTFSCLKNEYDNKDKWGRDKRKMILINSFNMCHEHVLPHRYIDNESNYWQFYRIKTR